MSELTSLTKASTTEEGDININTLSAEERAVVTQKSKEINLTDSQAVIQYGLDIQSKISKFSDTILANVKSKDAGFSGEVVTDLLFKIKKLDVNQLASAGDNDLSKIPFVGGLFNSIQRFVAKYEKLEVQLDKIIDNLDRTRMELLKDIGMYDSLFEKNESYVKDLNICIMAGILKLAELNDLIIPEMKQKATESNSQYDAQKVSDMVQLADRFDKKIHNLKLSRFSAIQRCPQIRLLQGGDSLLVDKIQTSIVNVIPMWKDTIVIAIGACKQKKALKLQQQVDDTTNNLLIKTSEMLKENSIEIAKVSEKGIIELETLKTVNANLISTIEEIAKIGAEGKSNRAKVEIEIGTLEKDLKSKLIEIR